MFEEYGSDYKRPNLDLDTLLPAVNRSEVSKSILSTLFQRWLTKPEVVGVSGTIGFPLSNISDAILESTTGRQAYQLSPVYQVTYGTEDTIYNWTDILRKASHVGVDPIRYSSWGAVNQLNFAPPINLSKFLDYSGYYWVNRANVVELPDYVTITKTSTQSDPWSLQNHWYTRAEVESPYEHGLTTNPYETWTGIAKQAVYPIIEFEDVELNQWVKVTRKWNFRPNLASKWTLTTSEPTDQDIVDPLFTHLWHLVEEAYSPCENKVLTATLHTQIISVPTLSLTTPAYLYGQHSIIVQVDGHRFYNFIEREESGSAYSTVIEFTKPISGTITVYVGAHTSSDSLRSSVVTTVLETASPFTSTGGTRVAGTIPKNLARYLNIGQAKQAHSQQPQFNLYDVVSDQVIGVGTIWEYVSDLNNAKSRQLNKRIWSSNSNEDFKFTSDLVDDGALRTYHSGGTPSTIWRGESTYTPRYVNQNRQAEGDVLGLLVPPGSGIWEPSPLLTFNPQRETRQELRYSEVVPHFRSILDTQSTGTTDWSSGGIIKIAHGGESHFVSSLLAKHIALPNLINFAIEQYHSASSSLEQQAISPMIELLLTKSTSRYSLARSIYQEIKAQAVARGSNDLIFHDTQTYNPSTHVGFPNIVPSLPMLGVVTALPPSLVVDSKLGVITLQTHSGHIRNLPSNKSQVIAVVSALATQTTTSLVAPPPTANALWLDSLTSTLKQFAVDHFTTNSVEPASSTLGALWYDAPTNQLRSNTPAGWVVVSNLVGWVELDATVIVAEVLLEYEKDLYARTQELQPQLVDWISIPQANPTLTNQLISKDYSTAAKHLNRHPNQSNILTRSYVQTKAFTWWYGNTFLGAINAPHPDLVGVWGNTTLEIYTKLYGTAHPHLQPWCIQGYTEEPSWWAQHYQDHNKLRRWNPIMWDNIHAGLVPSGKELPNVGISTGGAGEVRPCARTSVNTSSVTTSDKIQPDDLFPPYWIPITATDSSADGEQLLANLLAINSTVPPVSTVYGINTVTEFTWKQSIEYIRSLLISAHSIDPLKLYTEITQPNSISVNGLTINPDTHNVHSQGDLLQGDDLHFDPSLLSLIVLFSRYHTLLNVNDSPLMAWKTWTTKLAYQTGSIVVPQTLKLYEDCSPLENYKIVLKKTENVKTISFSNLIVSLSTAGSPLTIPQGDGADWSYRVDSSESIVETRRRYGVLLRSMTWKPLLGCFEFVGTSPWLSGEATKLTLPSGDVVDVFIRNIESPTPGISRVDFTNSNTSALTQSGGANSYGTSEFSVVVKSLESTFTAGDPRTPRTWEYITPDISDIVTFEFPVVITGVQNLINFIHSYVRFMEDDGVVFAHGENPTQDPDTQEFVDWNQQVRRLVNTIYNSNGLSNRRYVPDSSYTTRRVLDLPYVELNPFRDRLWINTPEGVVCNVYNTPYTTELQSTACIFDDIGDPISEDIVPLRTDRITTLFYENRKRVGNPIANQNKFQHIGSGKISLDYYEHALLFDQQTVNGLIVYDRFLNIQKPTMRLEFQRSIQHFYRPTVGGFVVTPSETLPNFETTAQYQRHDWNVNNSNELIESTAAVRSGMGKMPLPYFQTIPVSSKTEFQFWQKMIRQKGTKAVGDVFTKHKVYDQNEVDEYWAWKLGTFGAVAERTQVSFNITSDDLINDFCNFRFSTGT
jgi:hypothetical protein